jgi:UDP-4-amino-4,6-dideoxy-N-acetyl-beta-L-altrosamine transaminase
MIQAIIILKIHNINKAVFQLKNMDEFIPYATQDISEEDIKEVVNTLKSGWLTTGPKVKEFEDSLCNYLGCKYAIAVNSGTSALDIAVKALNFPEGSEIITTPFTFVADSNAVLYNNLKPIFADIEEGTRNIDPDQIRKKITKRTKAIIYVNYAGHPCDIDEIKKIARENYLFLIEDSCHALGAEYKGIKIGNFADMTILSFHPVKHITTGEGGAIVTNNEELAKKLKTLRNHGIDKAPSERESWAYDMKDLGRNYRITDIQCSLGASQIKKMDDFIKRRQEISKKYNEEFSKIDWIKTPDTKYNVKHAWHLYTVLLKGVDRNNFFEYMKKNNIGVNVHYIPSYKFTYYKRNFNISPEEFPVTEDVFNRIITLPLYPKMTNEQVERVIRLVREYKQ